MRTATMLLAAALTTVTTAACNDDPVDVQQHHHETAAFTRAPVAGLPGLAKEVKRATARLESTTQAQMAGYAESHDCVEVPGVGGMGYHWANVGLIDAEFRPLQPEVVLYEPGPNGKPKLVAVEYIVVDVGQPAPTFQGQPFDVGGTPMPVPHWSLHVWLHKANPNGLFTPFNPSVSCS